MNIEKVAAAVHKAYCANYLKHKGKPYFTGGEYALLDDEAKEIDRATVKAVLSEVLFALEIAMPREGYHPEYRNGFTRAWIEIHKIFKTTTTAYDGRKEPRA